MWSLDNATVAETVEGFSHRNLPKYRAGVPHFYYTRYNETQHSLPRFFRFNYFCTKHAPQYNARQVYAERFDTPESVV